MGLCNSSSKSTQGAHREGVRRGRVVGGDARPWVDVVGAPPSGAGAVTLHAREEDVAAVVAIKPRPPVLEALHAVAAGSVDVSRRLVGHRGEHALLRAVTVVHVKVQQRHAADACSGQVLCVSFACEGTLYRVPLDVGKQLLWVYMERNCAAG